MVVRSLLEEVESRRLDFVGSATMEVPTEDLARRITERIGFSLREFRRRANVDQAFNYLRARLEESGIFVLLLGNLGSHHTNIPVEAFRGFAIADAIAPFVIINDQDSKPAWSFTAFHEVVHLWLGTTGISGTSGEATIEQYCNDIAGEILLPTAEVADLGHLRRAALSETVATLSTFAQSRRLSRAMVAYKLRRSGIIQEEKWRELRDYFRQEWLAVKARQAEVDRGEGGPNYYVVKRHRLGSALVELVRHSLGEGLLTPTKAGQVLGVKPRNVEPLLQETPLRGG
jgi:Zn-dependent peptidase ImmA (M78 family)